MEYIDIQLVSDVHLEFHPRLYKPIEPKAPILLLCGDIGYPKKDHRGLYWQFIDYYADKFEKIFIVAGNHEYYQGANLKNFRYKPFIPINKMDEMIKEECKVKYKNVSYLQCDSEIYNGVRFIGCTLWTDIDADTFAMMNDCNNVYTETGKISRTEMQDLHKKQRLWLEEQLFDTSRPTVVMTHHLPSFNLIDSNFKSSIYNSGYASKLDYLIEYPAVAWFYGHSHKYKEFMINGIYTIANPRGYPSEKTGFDGSKVYNIKLK